MKCLRSLAIVGLTLLGVSVHALGGGTYLCTIERIDSADNKHAKVKAHRDARYLGKRFTVNRDSGIMNGALDNVYKRLPTVIDSGSSSNSFKAVTTMLLSEGYGAGTDIHALTVMEFVPEPTKPFVHLWNSEIFYGTCENL